MTASPMILKVGLLTVLSGLAFYLGACSETNSVSLNESFNQSVETKRHLYIATGACYGGGVTTLAGPSNMISKFDLQTRTMSSIVIDYNKFNPGDSPVSFVDYDNDRLLVLVENTAGRRLDLVNKDGSGAITYLTNPTALSAVLRDLVLLADFSLLVSKSSAIEKINSARVRVTQGANPWINAPAGACATSTTMITSLDVLENGKVLISHAAASPNNKIVMISSTGYAAAGDCLASHASPVATALPTSILNHSSGKTLVSFGSTTAASNLIYSYDVNSTTNTITGATPSWTDYSVVNGPSTMIEDEETGEIYVSNVTSTFNTVERFQYDSTTMTLTRAESLPFLYPSIYTRCITDMGIFE